MLLNLKKIKLNINFSIYISVHMASVSRILTFVKHKHSHQYSDSHKHSLYWVNHWDYIQLVFITLLIQIFRSLGLGNRVSKYSKSPDSLLFLWQCLLHKDGDNIRITENKYIDNNPIDRALLSNIYKDINHIIYYNQHKTRPKLLVCSLSEVSIPTETCLALVEHCINTIM